MQSQIPRTRITALSDAELLILDILATNRSRRRNFRRDVFGPQFNYPCHDLDDDTLEQTLESFADEGLVSCEEYFDDRSHRYLALTSAGGRLWESERRPDWTRYVTGIYSGFRPRTQRPRIAIYGHSLSICRAYFDAGCSSGHFHYRGGRNASADCNRQLIYWRPTARVYVVSAWLESWSCETDWSYLEMKRSWWSSPDEIGKFWGWPPALDGR